MEVPEDHVKIVEDLRAAVGAENILDSKIPRPRRVFLTIKTEKLKDAVALLVNGEFPHLSTISGADIGDGILVVYHFTRQGHRKGLTLSLRVKIPMENPVLPTIADITPSSSFYEREVHDMFGVVFEGHPNLAPLELPDGWPEDLHPLLKKYKLDDIRKKLSEVGRD